MSEIDVRAHLRWQILYKKKLSLHVQFWLFIFRKESENCAFFMRWVGLFFSAHSFSNITAAKFLMKKKKKKKKATTSTRSSMSYSNLKLSWKCFSKQSRLILAKINTKADRAATTWKLTGQLKAVLKIRQLIRNKRVEVDDIVFHAK